jgi:asparagine synthase (glutamine-hydrolysing)
MYAGLLSVSFNEDQLDEIQTEGNVRHLESEMYHFYIFGSIQHVWFLDDVSCTNKLHNNCYDNNFYRTLNGHFSLIIIDKSNAETRLVANNSGGVRLYVQSFDTKLIVSTQLALLDIPMPEINFNTINEVVDYRWNSGENSLIAHVMQLPSACYWQFKQTNLARKVCYNHFPCTDAIDSTPIDIQVKQVEKLLTTAITDAIKPNAKVAVLLSGGVDSSVLAALANKHQKNLVAISHRSDDQQNPELSTAVQFAKELGIEHQIYTINNDDIVDAFNKTIDIIEQPARYQSSLILYKLFEKMSGKFDQIIYGEAADTLFGSSLVKRYKLRTMKQERLFSFTKKIPFAKHIINLFPKENKIRMLQNENYLDYMQASSKIGYLNTSQLYLNQWRNNGTDLNVLNRLIAINDIHKVSKTKYEVSAIKSYLMRSDRDNHFHETGALAAHFNMELISPFIDYRVINYAGRLDDKSYYGENYVKPILRKIGCQYFTKSLMYITKKGFPAPFESWIEGPLKPLWKQTQLELKIPNGLPQDHELQWTMLCLHKCISNFDLNVVNKPSK